MAQLAEAYVDIVGRDTGLRISLTKAQADVMRAAGAMQARLNSLAADLPRLGKAMTMAVTLPIAAAAAVSLKAYSVQEDALVRLRSALDLVGDASDANMQRFSAFASEIQKATVYGDELVMSVMAQGRNLGIQTDQLEAATKAAVGLAEKYKLDLNTAMMLIGRAANGNTAMLRRYGISLDDTLSPQAKFAELLRLGAEGFKLAEDRAKTTSGQLLQLKNAFGDLQEQIGEALVPTLKRLVESMKLFVGWMQKLSPTTRDTIVRVGALAAALGPLLWIIGKVKAAVLGLRAALLLLNTNPVILAITAVVALIVGMTAALSALSNQLKEWKKQRDAAFKVEGLESKNLDELQAELDTTKKLIAERKKMTGRGGMIPTEAEGTGRSLATRAAMLEMEILRRRASANIGGATSPPGPSPVAKPIGPDQTDMSGMMAKFVEWYADLLRKGIELRRNAWTTMLDMTEGYTVRMIELAEGETAARMKALDIEATKRRDLIYANVKDEERRAMLMKALDADIGAQKADIMDEESKRADEEARAEAQRRRDKVGFAGGLSDVWRSAMTAGARLGVPVPPEIKAERYSKDQLEELKKIADWSEKQYLLAQSNLNKLAAAESML